MRPDSSVGRVVTCNRKILDSSPTFGYSTYEYNSEGNLIYTENSLELMTGVVLLRLSKK